MGDWAIETQGLVKRYGAKTALDGLNLAVPRGVLAGFVGLNGAGKTTTLRILLQMARADAGTARMLGFDCADTAQSLEIRRRTAFVPEGKALFPYMRVGEIIAFTRSFYPKWRGDLEKKYAADFELSYEDKIPGLSKGTLTKLQLLLALSRGTELVLLDEPTDGLDPLGVEVAMQALVGFVAEEGVTVLFSSHRLNEMEQLADYLCIIHKGRELVSGPLDDLKAACQRVVMVFADDAERIGGDFRDASRVRVDGRTVSVLSSNGVDSVVRRGQALGASSIDVQPLGLREMFIELVKGDGK